MKATIKPNNLHLYKLYIFIAGKDAALDAAHSLKTDTDCKLYGMGVRSPINATKIENSNVQKILWHLIMQVSAEQKKDKRTVEDIQVWLHLFSVDN